MKRILSLFCAAVILIVQTGCSSADKKAATLLDKEGNTIAVITKLDFSDDCLQDINYRSYAESVVDEAVLVLSVKYGCSAEEAAQKLFREGFTLKTEFDPTVFGAVNTMYEGCDMPTVGCAVLGQNGNVLAIYSAGEEQYGKASLAPYSTIKPLGVYAPAMEEGLISWSTGIVDKPYTQIIDERGNKVNWPTNPSGGYTHKRTTLLECIRQSLNTASVHTLKKLGVKKSIEFLTDSFGLDLGLEKNKLVLEGEDEVIGNIALGYLNVGITPVQLAGCYQIFAREGKYIKPHTISSITDKDGNEVFVHTGEEKQVIGDSTAYIINRLLAGVVTSGGTGAAAKVEGCELIGKTGTGTENSGNWFVGVTPEYSCAVWHGGVTGMGNISAELFTEIMKNMPKPEITKFSAPQTVRKGVYCSDSGKLFSPDCNKMQIGYYVQADKPDVCDAH